MAHTRAPLGENKPLWLLVELGGPSLEPCPGSEPTDPVDHKTSDHHQRKSGSQKGGVHIYMTRNEELGSHPTVSSCQLSLRPPTKIARAACERHQPASKHPQEWTYVSPGSGLTHALDSAARRAIGHRSAFHVPRVHPVSAHARKRRGLCTRTTETRASPPTTAWIYLGRCAKRHQAKPGKVRETAQKIDERAGSEFSDIDGISVPQNLCNS